MMISQQKVRHEATIKKDPACQAKLAEWWANKMKGKKPGDVSATMVDKKEKIRLAEEVGLTEKKIDYWLWTARKKEKQKGAASDGSAAVGKENNAAAGKGGKKKARV